MKKQELCQVLESKLKNQFNQLIINNINNYLWVALSKKHELLNCTIEVLEADTEFNLWIKQLKQGMPIQYVVQNACFYGLDLEVNTDVLIPRPETEELVSWILSDFKNPTSRDLLDIGTGSGCIAIAIKKHRPEWNIMAIDVSPSALKIAKKNAAFHKLEVEFIEADFLINKISLTDTYDLIVSNPPYISEEEYDHISESILYEPDIALFPKGNDPLVFYREIANWSLDHLKKSGIMYFELNEFLVAETQEIFRKVGYSKIEIRDDLQGKKRMMKVSGGRL